MVDTRLEELVRVWRASGRLADEVALLRERVRAGALDRERLRLAAYCGHVAANAALEQPLDRTDAWRDWVRGFDGASLEAKVCVGLGALTVEPPAIVEHAHPPQAPALEVLRAGERWLARADATRQEAVRRAVADAAHAGAEVRFSDPVPLRLRLAVGVGGLLEDEAATRLSELLDDYLEGFQERVAPSQVNLARDGSGKARALRRTEALRLRSGIERYVATWALRAQPRP